MDRLKNPFLFSCAFVLITSLFCTIYSTFPLWFNQSQDGTENDCVSSEKIRQKLSYQEYADQLKCFRNIVKSSSLSSKKNADVAKRWTRSFWIIGGITVLLMGLCQTLKDIEQRQKTLSVLAFFLALITFGSSSYDSKGRWAFSRIAQYEKELLVYEWELAAIRSAQIEDDYQKKVCLEKATIKLMEKFGDYRRLSTEQFFKLNLIRLNLNEEINIGGLRNQNSNK